MSDNNSNTLERMWSPDPIYACKVYQRYAVTGSTIAFNGPIDVNDTDTIRKYECMYHNRPLFRDIKCKHSVLGDVNMVCEGKFGSQIHTRRHTHGCEDEAFSRTTTQLAETCGFYAFKLEFSDNLKNFWRIEKTVLGERSYPQLILVSLHGTIVEYDHGYKATHQRIEEHIDLDYEIQDSIYLVAESFINRWRKQIYDI